jgi:hypothetical protein
MFAKGNLKYTADWGGWEVLVWAGSHMDSGSDRAGSSEKE